MALPLNVRCHCALVMVNSHPPIDLFAAQKKLENSIESSKISCSRGIRTTLGFYLLLIVVRLNNSNLLVALDGYSWKVGN